LIQSNFCKKNEYSCSYRAASWEINLKLIGKRESRYWHIIKNIIVSSILNSNYKTEGRRVQDEGWMKKGDGWGVKNIDDNFLSHVICCPKFHFTYHPIFSLPCPSLYIISTGLFIYETKSSYKNEQQFANECIFGKCFGIVNCNSVSLVLIYIKTKTNMVKQTNSSDLDIHHAERGPSQCESNFYTNQISFLKLLVNWLIIILIEGFCTINLVYQCVKYNVCSTTFNRIMLCSFIISIYD
jgi:hypothetical protein